MDFLKDKQKVGKREIARKRKRGELDFADAGILLNTLCSYNAEREEFELRE